MLPAVYVLYMYIYFSDRMIEWYILGGAKVFSSLYLASQSQTFLKGLLKLVIFFLLLDPYNFLILEVSSSF